MLGGPLALEPVAYRKQYPKTLGSAGGSRQELNCPYRSPVVRFLLQGPSEMELYSVEHLKYSCPGVTKVHVTGRAFGAGEGAHDVVGDSDLFDLGSLGCTPTRCSGFHAGFTVGSCGVL